MVCSKCQASYEDSKFCPNCGTPSSFFCSKCGASHSEKFCPQCGNAVAELQGDPPNAAASNAAQPQVVIYNNNENTNANNNEARPYPHKSKMVALLACIFTGIFGGHYFYVGKFSTGILYLFTGGLFGIGCIIDIIRIAIGSFRDKYGQFLV